MDFAMMQITIHGANMTMGIVVIWKLHMKMQTIIVLNAFANQMSKKVLLQLVKVSKSQKHFFLKLYCPKNERNIRQNSAL